MESQHQNHRILLFVGEDHSSATHAISRDGWLKIAKQLVKKENPTICRVLEKTDQKAKTTHEKNSYGYTATEGIETESIVNEAFRNIFAKMEVSFREYISAHDISVFPRQHKDIADRINEKWTELAEEQKTKITNEFCKDVRLHLSYTEQEIEKLLENYKSSALTALEFFFLILNAAMHGKANIRHRENCQWAKRICEIGEKYDVIIVFIGADHMQSVTGKKDSGEEIKLFGLRELFQQDAGSFSKIYVVSNKKADGKDDILPGFRELLEQYAPSSTQLSDTSGTVKSSSLPSNSDNVDKPLLTPDKKSERSSEHLSDDSQQQNSTLSPGNKERSRQSPINSSNEEALSTHGKKIDSDGKEISVIYREDEDNEKNDISSEIGGDMPTDECITEIVKQLRINTQYFVSQQQTQTATATAQPAWTNLHQKKRGRNPNPSSDETHESSDQNSSSDENHKPLNPS